MTEIRERRIALDLQQKEVAEQAGVSIATVSKIERYIPVGEEAAKCVLAVLGLEMDNVKVVLLEKRKRIRRK